MSSVQYELALWVIQRIHIDDAHRSDPLLPRLLNEAMQTSVASNTPCDLDHALQTLLYAAVDNKYIGEGEWNALVMAYTDSGGNE